MLDQLSEITVNQNTTIKRAATDESVRLLREMELAAEKQVLSSIRLDNNVIDGVLHTMQDFLSGERRFRCVFKLNGQAMQADFTARYGDTKEQMGLGIRDEIARTISNHISVKVLSACKDLKW